MTAENLRWDLPTIAIALLTIAFAAAVLKGSRHYRELVDREISSVRFHAIDGLRGYLALGVLLHHVGVNYLYYVTGDWGAATSNFVFFLGRGGVAFFFMITAFLFWNKALDSGGRIDAPRFYISRLRRILPMYWVAAGLLIVTALALTGFLPRVPLFDLLGQMLAWVLFTFPGELNINGLEHTKLINTVFWSLVWEWLFYLFLPLLALMIRARHRWAWYALIFAYIALLSRVGFEWFFLTGCVTAAITRRYDLRALAKSKLASLVAIACIVATIVWAPSVYRPLGAALMFIPFVVFAVGNSLFGVLTCRPARFLGLLSYSVYLLHNWVIFVTSRIFSNYITIGEDSLWAYWSLAVFVAFATVMLSSLTYRFVESPYLKSNEAVRPPLEVPPGMPERKT